MFLEDSDVESVRLMDPARKEEDYIVIMDDADEESGIDILRARKSHEMIANE